MKKILSLVLVIALVLGSFSFAFAAVPADVTNDDQVDAVNVLMALGIVNGYPDGTYKPDRVVTRAEMAKLLVEALGYGQLAGGTAPYSDTAGHWAQGSIGLASGIGLVQGYPDGTFKPDATVTFDEAVTMILRALGYTDASLRGAWPTNYKIKAIDLGLYDNTTAQAGGADRGNVAVMLYNALFIKYGEVNADNVFVQGDKDLITKLGAKEFEFTVAYSDVVGDDALESAVDLMDYLYMTIKAYVSLDEDEVFAVKSVVSVKTVGEVTTTAGMQLAVEKADEKVTTFSGLSSSTKIFYNGTEASTTEYTDLQGLDVTVIHLKDSTSVQGIWVWASDSYLVEKAYAANAKVIDVFDASDVKLATAEVDDKEVVDTANITVMGDVNTLAGIAKNDVIYVYASDNDDDYATPEKIKIEVVRDVVEGKVTEVSSDNKTVVLGGVSLGNPKQLTLNLGDTYSVALGKDGKIFATITAVETPANYAVVKARAVDQTDTFGNEVADKVQLLIANGNLVVYDVDADTTPAVGAKITYTLNTDGEVSDWDLVETTETYEGATYNSTFKLVASTKLLNDDTIIFDVEEFEVLAASELGGTITATAILASDSNYIKVLYVTDKGSAADSDKTYAVITGFSLVLDGSTTVQKVTHYLDEVYPVVTNTNANGVVDADTELNVLVEVTLNTSGKLTAVVPVTTGGVAQGVMGPKVGNLIYLGDQFHEVDSNVVVYLVDEDMEVTGVGSMADVVEDANIKVYFLGEDEIQYIFVYEGELPPS